MIRTPHQSPSPSPTSGFRTENIPWYLFKRDVQSLLIPPLDLSATEEDNSNLPVIRGDGQNFRLMSSSPTGFRSGGISNAAIDTFDPMSLFSPNLHDWTFENDITQSLLLDIAFSRTSLEANQTGLVPSSSRNAKVSNASALSFLSELSFKRFLTQMSAVSDLTAFLRRYTVDDGDLELSACSKALGNPIDGITFYRLFSLFIYLISNNLVTFDDTNNILAWMVTNDSTWMIMNILELSSTTVDVFASRIFPAAVKAGQIDLVRKLICRGIDVNIPALNSLWGEPRTAFSLAVETRDLEMIKLLHASGATPKVLNISVIRNDQSHGSLWSSNNMKILSSIIELGADPEIFVADRPRGFPLVIAAYEGELEAARLLLDAHAQPDWAIPEFGTALQAAAARGHEAVVRILIERCADVNSSWRSSSHPYYNSLFSQSYVAFKTPIQLAARGNHTGIVQTLLQSGALVNYSPSIIYLGLPRIEDRLACWNASLHGEERPFAYPVQYAVHHRNITLVPQLLAAGAQVDSRIGTNYGDTPLQTAARLSDVAITRLLLDHKANVNAPAGKYCGRTAIQAAAETGNTEIVKLLLDAKADINASAGWQRGRTAVQAAIENRHKAAVTILLESGADTNGKPAFHGGITALQAAAITGDMELFQMALEQGAHINAPAGPIDGITALQAVMKHKDLAALKIVLQARADVNGRQSFNSEFDYSSDGPLVSNKTPLQYAVCLGWLEGVQCLLDWGSDIDALPLHPYFETYSALGCAVLYGDDDLIALLLQNGANPNISAINVDRAPSAFTLALENGSHDIVKLFLQHHADITRCWDTKSALESAVSGGSIDVVETIMNLMSQLPGDQYQSAVKKSLAFVFAHPKKSPNYDLVKVLVQAGADANACDPWTHETLLQKSVGAGAIDAVRLLLDNGADVNIPATEETGTPLQVAILYGRLETAEILLEHGADVNAPPCKRSGATALQAAAMRGYYSLVLRLLKYGADVAAAPSAVSGRTAIDGAAEHGRLDILHILLNAYGDRPDLPVVCNHAVSVAERNHHTGVANWLKTYRSHNARWACDQGN